MALFAVLFSEVWKHKICLLKMAVNLVKYKEEMLKAWKEVVDDKNPTDWALFTYDGQSYDLKLASKGGNA